MDFVLLFRSARRWSEVAQSKTAWRRRFGPICRRAHMPQGPYAAGTHRATRRHRERLLCSSNTIVSTTTINIWWLHDDLRVRSSSPLSRSPFARSHLRPSQLSLSASRAPLHLIPWDSLAKYWLAPIRCIRVTLTWRIDFTLLNNTCTYDLF